METKESIKIAPAIPIYGNRYFYLAGGLVSLLALIVLIESLVDGISILESQYPVGPYFLASVMVQGLGCLSLLQAYQIHHEENYIQYRNWLILAAVLGAANLVLFLRAQDLLLSLMSIKTWSWTWILLEALVLSVGIYFALGYASLMRMMALALRKSNYIDGFIEAIQHRFVEGQQKLLRYWLTVYALSVVVFALTVLQLTRG